MDLDIKPDPDMLEDHFSESAEFLEEKHNICETFATSGNNYLQQNSFPATVGSALQYEPSDLWPQTVHSAATITNLKSDVDVKIIPNIILAPNNSNHTAAAVPAVSVTLNKKSNVQRKVISNMILSSLPYDPSHIPPQITHSYAVVPSGNFISNVNSNLQEKVVPIKSEFKPMVAQSFATVPSERFAPNILLPQLDRSATTSSTVSQLKQKGISKSKVNKKTPKLNWKREFLRIFENDGCSLKRIERIANDNNINKEMIIEFYNNVAQKTQHNVHEECDSLSFNNVTQWLKYLSAVGISDQCNYEAAIVLNAITHDEHHPEPKSMSDIDLKAIYKFLSNALMGLPQQQLNDASAKFLSNEFQNLINEANTDDADNAVRDMKRLIEETPIGTKNAKSYTLDPLNVNTEELKKCYEMIKK